MALPGCGREPSRLLLVTIDTLRADYVGCYGSALARTPNLDRLAEEGVRFETAIAPTPVTLPSHTTLMTGLDPPAHGVHGNETFRLEEGIPTLAERFRAAGFATAAFVGSAVLDRDYGLARGFDRYDDQMGFRRSVPGGGGAAERRADRVVDAALAWLDEAPERFLLWVHLYDPHANYDPPPRFRPAAGSQRGAAELTPELLYAGEIAFADHELGRLFAGLRGRFGDDGTLIVVASDHGESLGDHGELTHTLSLYDATQRIPLLWRGLGLPRGAVVAAPVRLVDVAPTLLSLFGVDPMPSADGSDLRPLWRGQAKGGTGGAGGRDAYLETLIPHLDYGWSPIYGLRTARHKYLRKVTRELYDLEVDPGETQNLAASDPERVAALDASLEARLAGARAIVPSRAPSAQDRALLESLGYLVRDSDAPLPEPGWVGGADPLERLPVVVQLIRARSELAQGDPASALAILEGAPEAGGWVAHARAEAELALGRFAEAERHARVLVAAQPGYANAHLLLGRALEALGRDDAARAAYEEAARVEPTESRATVALGRLRERAGDLDGAAALYTEAGRSRVPSAEGALRLALLRFEEGRVDAARAALALADDTSSAPPDVLAAALRAEARAGFRASARKRLVRAMDRGLHAPELTALYGELRETP